MSNITIDDNQINGMSRNPDLIKEFGFLTLTTTRSGCCGRRNTQTPNYEVIKQHLAGLDEDQKTKLKQLLNAESVKIYYKAGEETKDVTY